MYSCGIMLNTSNFKLVQTKRASRLFASIMMRCFHSSKAFCICNPPFEIIPVEEKYTTTSRDSESIRMTLQLEIADIIRSFYSRQIPVVLKRAVATSAACVKWKSLEYLNTRLGEVAFGKVEIGGSYATPGIPRLEIPFCEYIEYLKMFEQRHGSYGPEDPWEMRDLPPLEEIVYMAQNEVPSCLKDDLEVAAFCLDSSFNVGLGHHYSTMWWLGPRGCVSPLHYDPLDNVLMQLVGRKRVLLFSPHKNATGWHYAGRKGQDERNPGQARTQYNTCPIDIELEDEARLKASYPLFLSLAPFPCLQAVLSPGDLLYIPAKWWHHVRSLDLSVSVNSWWR